MPHFRRLWDKPLSPVIQKTFQTKRATYLYDSARRCYLHLRLESGVTYDIEHKYVLSGAIPKFDFGRAVTATDCSCGQMYNITHCKCTFSDLKHPFSLYCRNSHATSEQKVSTLAILVLTLAAAIKLDGSSGQLSCTQNYRFCYTSAHFWSKPSILVLRVNSQALKCSFPLYSRDAHTNLGLELYFKSDYPKVNLAAPSVLGESSGQVSITKKCHLSP